MWPSEAIDNYEIKRVIAPGVLTEGWLLLIGAVMNSGAPVSNYHLTTAPRPWRWRILLLIGSGRKRLHRAF